MSGITHGLHKSSSEPNVELWGHASRAKSIAWRTARTELLEKKQEVVASLPASMREELLEALAQGYGIRIVVIEPSRP